MHSYEELLDKLRAFGMCRSPETLSEQVVLIDLSIASDKSENSINR